MSVLRKGGKRRAAFVAALSLGVFQALSVIGAGPVQAAVNCTFTLATGNVLVTLTSGSDATISLSADTPAQVLVNGSACTGTPNVTNTTSISTVGSASNGEDVTIDNDGAGGAFPSTISWAVDGGGGTGDSLVIDGSAEDDVVTITGTAFTMNGASGITAGLEDTTVNGADGNDTIDASASPAGGALLFLNGDDGDDVVSGGAGDDEIDGGSGEDLLAGGGGVDVVDAIDGGDADVVDEGAAPNGDDTLLGDDVADTLDFSARTGCVVIDEVADESGEDTDCDGVLEAGEEINSSSGFIFLVGGSNNDTLTGNGSGETFIGNDGDDVVDGNGGFNTMSWETATGPITVDSAAGTSTGQGDDSWTDIDELLGSPSLEDTLDFSGEAAGVGANLSELGPFNFPPVNAGGPGNVNGSSSFDSVVPETFENATGTDFDDHLVGGNTSNSTLMGGAGNDRLGGLGAQDTIYGQDGNDLMFGDDGNDTLLGGLGDDTYIGGTGADTASFKESPAGVEVDASLGFASGEGDDVLNDDLEIFVGSSFADNMTGGGGLVAANYRFIGRGGKDILTGSGSNDTIKGGGGKDILRGAAGDDTIFGNKGNDRLFGGAGTDVGKGGPGKDVCKSIEIKSSCGTKKHPKSRQLQVAARRQI